MANSDDEKDEPFARPVPSFGDQISHHSEVSKPVVENDQSQSAHDGTQQQNPLSDVDVPTNNGPEGSPDNDLYDAYPLSVKDIRLKLFGLGISKSKDSIQRYCRKGMLDCVKLGMLRRYYVTEASVDALIETLQNDEASSSSMQRHEAERSSNDEQLSLHGSTTDEEIASGKDLHEASSSGMQADAVARSGAQLDDNVANPELVEPVTVERETSDPGMIGFLKDQLRVKDEQIKIKDEQISTMLERDKETNILIGILQDQIGDAFGLLVGGKREERNHAARAEIRRPPVSDQSNPHVENRDGQ